MIYCKIVIKIYILTLICESSILIDVAVLKQIMPKRSAKTTKMHVRIILAVFFTLSVAILALEVVSMSNSIILVSGVA